MNTFPTDLKETLPPLHGQRTCLHHTENVYFITGSVANTVPKDLGERQLQTMLVKDIPLGLRDAHTNGVIPHIPQSVSHQ